MGYFIITLRMTNSKFEECVCASQNIVLQIRCMMDGAYWAGNLIVVFFFVGLME